MFYQNIKKIQIGSKISYLNLFYVLIEHNIFLSEHKKDSDWVQNIISDPNVSFKVNNKTYKGYARIVDKSKEPTLANAVSDLMLRKYGWNDGLIVELTSNDNIK